MFFYLVILILINQVYSLNNGYGYKPGMGWNSDYCVNCSTNTNGFQPSVKNIFVASSKRGCEWPMGHPDEPDFHFCNKERFEEKPYCLEHCAVAYVIPEKEEVRPMPRVGTIKYK